MAHIVYNLSTQEYHKYRTHLLALDSASRYTRFGYAASDYFINQFCDKIEKEPQNHKLFVIEDTNLTVVAVGHIAINPDDIELAFSVLQTHQRQGMGSSLMTRCLEWCQNRNIKTGSMVCLSSNTPIKKLAAKHGVLVTEGPETIASIKIPGATPFSIMSEVMGENISAFDHITKLQWKIVGTVLTPAK